MNTCDYDSCTRPVHAQGHCKAHYQVMRRKGTLGTVFEKDPVKRFWSYVDRTGGCWLWTGGGRAREYGQFTVAWQRIPAHRYAYELLVGPIPDGMQLDHLCRVPLCVNPAHLEPVSGRENLMRGGSPVALNVVKTHCPAGHAYDDENTYRDAVGRRSCRKCRTATVRRYRQRQRSLDSDRAGNSEAAGYGTDV